MHKAKTKAMNTGQLNIQSGNERTWLLLVVVACCFDMMLPYAHDGQIGDIRKTKYNIETTN